MMPFCQHRRCNKVSDGSLGTIIYPGEKDGYGEPWTEPAYLCNKHLAKIRKLLQIRSKS